MFDNLKKKKKKKKDIQIYNVTSMIHSILLHYTTSHLKKKKKKLELYCLTRLIWKKKKINFWFFTTTNSIIYYYLDFFFLILKFKNISQLANNSMHISNKMYWVHIFYHKSTKCTNCKIGYIYIYIYSLNLWSLLNTNGGLNQILYSV